MENFNIVIYIKWFYGEDVHVTPVDLDVFYWQRFICTVALTIIQYVYVLCVSFQCYQLYSTEPCRGELFVTDYNRRLLKSTFPKYSKVDHNPLYKGYCFFFNVAAFELLFWMIFKALLYLLLGVGGWTINKVLGCSCTRRAKLLIFFFSKQINVRLHILGI